MAALILLIAVVGTGATPVPLLANWMGALAPILANATVLDLSLPGAHDTMTYDLSTTLSDGYEGAC